jgi:hypothetical protein
MGLKKNNLNIEMDFTNFRFHLIYFFGETFSCLIFYLKFMVLQCVVVKSCRLNFQLLYKKKNS